MADNYNDAFQKACDLADAGYTDVEALSHASDHCGLTGTQRRQLTREFALLGSQAPPGRRRAEYDDFQSGQRWWNGLSEAERVQWLTRVQSSSVAAAWRVHKAERGS
jgi:hypothetical protein